MSIVERDAIPRQKEWEGRGNKVGGKGCITELQEEHRLVILCLCRGRIEPVSSGQSWWKEGWGIYWLSLSISCSHQFYSIPEGINCPAFLAYVNTDVETGGEALPSVRGWGHTFGGGRQGDHAWLSEPSHIGDFMWWLLIPTATDKNGSCGERNNNNNNNTEMIPNNVKITKKERRCKC